MSWTNCKLANILFIVEFKLLMLNCPFVEKLFKLLIKVVDVLSIFGMSKYDWVDKLLKLENIVVYVLLIFGMSKYDWVDNYSNW